MISRFNPPPNWPAPPADWQPAPGWQPDPEWGPLPPGWQLWVPDIARPPLVAAQTAIDPNTPVARAKRLLARCISDRRRAWHGAQFAPRFWAFSLWHW